MPPVVTFGRTTLGRLWTPSTSSSQGEVSVHARLGDLQHRQQRQARRPVPGLRSGRPVPQHAGRRSPDRRPDGGTWTLDIDCVRRRATGAIPWNATAAQIEPAIDTAVGPRSVRVAGDAPGPITVEIAGEQGDRPVTITGDDSLTGGTEPCVDVDVISAGGRDPDNITSLIMPSIVLPEGSYAIDLVYVGGDDDGDSMLDDMVDLYVAE